MHQPFNNLLQQFSNYQQLLHYDQRKDAGQCQKPVHCNNLCLCETTVNNLHRNVLRYTLQHPALHVRGAAAEEERRRGRGEVRRGSATSVGVKMPPRIEGER